MLETYIAEPTIFLMGCRPWPPPWPYGEPCPVCGSDVRNHREYCGWSDEGTQSFEGRVRSARLGLKARAPLDARKQKARDRLAKAAKMKLTEVERRRIWNGYRKTILEPIVGKDVTNRALIGRTWLAAIAQEPDWTIVLDRHGRVA